MPASTVYNFNGNWLFGGQYVAGAERREHPDGHFAPITLPHTVTRLSWGGWNPAAWEHLWIYRKHFEAPASAGGRMFLDFQGVMTNARVFLGGVEVAQHRGGYLPWSVELTPRTVGEENVLVVVVDARWLDVPPGGHRGGAR